MDDYNQFVQELKKFLGIDLNLYKEAQMKRRLTSLRDKRGFNSFLQYFQAIKKDENLMMEFLDRMTINVTEFYRNFSRWSILIEKIIPKWKGNIKVWSAACSTGEEPYTLAMLFDHYFPQLNVEILATDIDEFALAKAKKGIYNERTLGEIPQDQKLKYFKIKDNLYYINDNIKHNVQFKKHNLLSDPFGVNQFDLIVCRNVLIYFTDQAKEEVYRNFSSALKPNGILFVGSTEQIFNPQKYNLKSIDTFFYQKI